MSAAMLCTTVVKRAVLAALDRGAREREMAAQLLRRLRATEVISRAHGEAGFDLLLQSLESLTIDVPNAPDDLHVFLARAVIDDVVSELFLEECADAAGLDVDARRVALSARGALKSLGGKGRVLDAWGGPDGGTASFANKEFDSLLTEYVESRDPREASRRVAALHVPFYHHELVKVRPCAFPKSRLHVCPYKTDTFFHNRKRALVFAIEESHFKPQCVRRITELLGYLGAAGVVSGTQFAKGFARVAVALKELALDTPDGAKQIRATRRRRANPRVTARRSLRVGVNSRGRVVQFRRFARSGQWRSL
jgi:programmed cell death protein 4